MKPNRSRALFAVVVLAGVLSSGRAMAQAADVKDQAALFSPAAVSKAQEAVKKLKALYNKDVRVETFKEVPARRAAAFRAMNAADKKKYLATSARARAESLPIKGIYLFILKDPGHLEIIVDDLTRQKAFPNADRDKLRDLMLVHFNAKTFDKGLEEGIAFIRDRFEERLGPRYPVALANQVKDYAPFFSKESVVRADQEIRILHQTYNKDLVIETFPKPPPALLKQMEGLNAQGRGRLFAGWLRDRARAAGVKGIHVLVCKEPPKIQVGMDEETTKKAFSGGDRDKLVQMLLAGFRAKNYDQALQEGVDYVYDTLDRNTASPLPPPVAGEVKDHAALFRSDIVGKAASDLKQIKAKAGGEVTFETLPRVPPGDLRKVRGLDPKGRGEYFAALGKARTEQAKAQGVWVLICKEPRHVWVAVGPAASKRFGKPESDKLQELLVGRLNANDLGGALQESVAYVAGKLKEPGTATVPPQPLKNETVKGPDKPKVETPIKPPPPPVGKSETAQVPQTKPAPVPANTEKESKPAKGFDPMWILWGVAGLVGLIIFIAILRAVFGRRSAPVQPSYPPAYQQPVPPQPQAAPPVYGSPRPQAPIAPQPQPVPPVAYGAPRQPPVAPPPGYAPGYGYPQAPPPPQGGGGGGIGGGLVGGILGGVIGGGAGAWLSNKMTDHHGAPPQPGPAGTGPHTSPPLPGSSGPGYSSSGGDFGEEPVQKTGYSSAGGDFGEPEAEAASSGGGDFGQPETESTSSGGGDFGQPETESTSSGGGDFGQPETESASSGGGDFGQAEEPSGSGGDFGAPAEPYAPEPANDDSASAGFSSPDSAGGDFGGSDSGGGKAPEGDF